MLPIAYLFLTSPVILLAHLREAPPSIRAHVIGRIPGLPGLTDPVAQPTATTAYDVLTTDQQPPDDPAGMVGDVRRVAPSEAARPAPKPRKATPRKRTPPPV